MVFCAEKFHLRATLTVTRDFGFCGSIPQNSRSSYSPLATSSYPDIEMKWIKKKRTRQDRGCFDMTSIFPQCFVIHVIDLGLAGFVSFFFLFKPFENNTIQVWGLFSIEI